MLPTLLAVASHIDFGADPYVPKVIRRAPANAAPFRFASSQGELSLVACSKDSIRASWHVNVQSTSTLLTVIADTNAIFMCERFTLVARPGDGMVLQMAPAQATVWGFVPAGRSVSVQFNGDTIASTILNWYGNNTWLAKLPRIEGSLKEYNISATSGGTTITLANIVFGDVWVCSGQSNSESDCTWYSLF